MAKRKVEIHRNRQVVMVFNEKDEEYVNNLLANGFYVVRMEGSGEGWVLVYLER
jgi:hypothetical protein